MLSNLLALALAVVAISFPSGTESAPCPTGTVAMNVASAADVQNLTDVLNCAGHGDFNVLWHSNQTLAQRIEVSDRKNVSVTGSAFPTIHGVQYDDNDAGGGSGMFYVTRGSTLRLSNLVLDGGSAENGGSVRVLSSSNLFVYSCTFSNNIASKGGAVYSKRSSVDVDGKTTFDNNVALQGGAIHGVGSNVSIGGQTSFSHNTAEGAVYVKESNLSIGGQTSFSHNTAEGYPVSSSSFHAREYAGGAIHSDVSSVHIDCDCIFADNSATYGGAMGVTSSQVYIAGDTSFVNNWAESRGGVMEVTSSEVYMAGNTSFVNNSADIGGAMDVTVSEVYMDGNTSFVENSAVSDGGAMLVHDSEVYMDDNTSFVNNWSERDVGAMSVLASEVHMDGDTSFFNNRAEEHAGAIGTGGSDVYFEGNTSFVNNSAEKGGAMDVQSSEVYMQGNTSFVKNSAVKGGAMHLEWSSDVYMEGNTSFVNNWAETEGGALFMFDSVACMEGNTEFVTNWADEKGGALSVSGSEVYMDGYTLFFDNSAADGGAMYVSGGNTATNGAMNRSGNLPRNEGDVHHEAGAEASSVPNIRFVENVARGLGGAIHVDDFEQLVIRGAAFESNRATLGGAMYIASTEARLTEFSACVFDGNGASDGGAVYLATGSGEDTFVTSVFRDNSADFSGGAIFHIGSLRVVDASFVANEAGVEGPAIVSIGLIKELSNVSFSENSFDCRATKYGYVVEEEEEEGGFCNSCFDEVCARCSTEHLGDTEFGDVRTNGMPVCGDPPAGAIAEASGTTVETLSLEEGYYRTSNQSHAILKCYQPSACVGGNDTAKYCAPGYDGPYCAVCVDGYTAGLAYSCNICSGGMKRWAVGLSIAVGLVALLLTARVFAHLGSGVRGGAGEDTGAARRLCGQKCWSCQGGLVKMLPLRAIKIVVTVWQIISQFDAVAGDVYPELYKAFVSKLTAFNLDLNFILSYSCLVTTDFYHHLLLATIAPLVMLVMLAGSYLVAKKRNASSESAKSAVRHKHQSVLLYFAFFIYSPVSYKVFQTFSCDELDDGNSYLRADYSVSCLTPRHSWYTAYAFVMVGIYPLGIAVVFACLLAWYRHDLVKPDRESIVRLKPFHGVWAAYKPSRYFYEVVECGRRVALTVIAAFVPSNSIAQVSIALMFAVVWVFISEAMSPFEKKNDMNLYRWGNGIVVASMYVAFLMRADVGIDTERALLTFSGVLILANVFMVVTVFLQTALLVKEWRGARDVVRAVDAPVRRTAH